MTEFYFPADPRCRAVYEVCLRPLECWDCGVESQLPSSYHSSMYNYIFIFNFMHNCRMSNLCPVI
jgi:hypothetical protein